MNDEYYRQGFITPAYEGASKGFKLEQRNLTTKEFSSLIAQEQKLLQSRSDYLIKNDGWAVSAFKNYRKHFQGYSVRWFTKVNSIHTEMQALWDDFAKDPAIDGYGDFNNIQDIWKAEQYAKGNAISRFIIQRRPGGGIPLYLQQIDSRLLDPSYMGKQPADNIRNSIQFDNLGRPLIYYFSALDPITYQYAMEKFPIPAEDIIHIFKRDFANQWLGVPELAPVITSLYDLSDLTDATIAKQQAAQAIAWVVKNSNPGAAAAVGTSSQRTKGSKKQTITTAEGGGTFYLEKGEDVAFYQGTDIGANLPNLMKMELHKIAKSLDLTYETLTGDLTGLSFSAIKAIIIELRHSIEFVQNLYYKNLGVVKVCERFKALALLRGPKNWQKVSYKIELPKFYGMDDLKDTQNDVLELMSGLGDYDAKLAERNITRESAEKTISFLQEVGLLADINKQTLAKQNAQANNMKANSNSTEV